MSLCLSFRVCQVRCRRSPSSILQCFNTTPDAVAAYRQRGGRSLFDWIQKKRIQELRFKTARSNAMWSIPADVPTALQLPVAKWKRIDVLVLCQK